MQAVKEPVRMFSLNWNDHRRGVDVLVRLLRQQVVFTHQSQAVSGGEEESALMQGITHGPELKLDSLITGLKPIKYGWLVNLVRLPLWSHARPAQVSAVSNGGEPLCPAM